MFDPTDGTCGFDYKVGSPRPTALFLPDYIVAFGDEGSESRVRVLTANDRHSELLAFVEIGGEGSESCRDAASVCVDSYRRILVGCSAHVKVFGFEPEGM